jgi:hypothetical protein
MSLLVEVVIIDRSVLRGVPIKDKFPVVEPSDPPLLLDEPQVSLLDGLALFLLVLDHLLLFGTP